MESLRTKVFNRDGNVCLKCGSALCLTIDHVVPRSWGGSADYWNLQTLCKKCNGAKGNFSDADYRKIIDFKKPATEILPTPSASIFNDGIECFLWGKLNSSINKIFEKGYPVYYNEIENKLILDYHGTQFLYSFKTIQNLVNSIYDPF